MRVWRPYPPLKVKWRFFFSRQFSIRASCRSKLTCLLIWCIDSREIIWLLWDIWVILIYLITIALPIDISFNFRPFTIWCMVLPNELWRWGSTLNYILLEICSHLSHIPCPISFDRIHLFHPLFHRNLVGPWRNFFLLIDEHETSPIIRPTSILIDYESRLRKCLWIWSLIWVRTWEIHLLLLPKILGVELFMIDIFCCCLISRSVQVL